ncbi:ComEC/Rec2 family competence protein [Cohnella cholangitidis]
MGLGIVGLKRRLVRREEQAWWERQEAEAMARSDDITATVACRTTETTVRPRIGIRIVTRIVFTFAVGCWFVWGYEPAWMNHSASVSFLNVGQGDSILIRTGGGKNILIDSGGTVQFRKAGEQWKTRRDPYEVGRKLIVPLLLKRGVRELDALVLTHFDADHIGGAQAVLDNIPVRTLLFNGTVKDSPGVLKLLQTATAGNIPAYAVHALMDWIVDESTAIRVLYPMTPAVGSDANQISIENDQNESSVVLYVTIFGRTFLFPGDLEESGEEEIVVREASDTLNDVKPGAVHRIDVLKAEHHGSKTSTTPLWTTYWLPRETVISVGANNFYGHPNGDVLDRLAEAGSLVWRTDLNGEIQYRIKPEGTMERRTLRTGNGTRPPGKP